MNSIDKTEVAKREFGAALKECEARNYCSETLINLENVIDRWTADEAFQRNDGLLRVTVLNQLAYLMGHESLGELIARKVRELAARTTEDAADGMRISLTVANFEFAAEPPEVPKTLEFLFSMERDPATRWAIFRSYERWPGRFRDHIERYSDGSITWEDYLNWLESQGLRLTEKGCIRRRKHHLHS